MIGSGNALCLNLLGVHDGFNLLLAALNAIKGKPLSIDLCTVTQLEPSCTSSPSNTTPKYKRWFSFLSQAVGMMADVDINTEALRMIGDTRFILGFIHGVVVHKQSAVYLDVLNPEMDLKKMTESLLSHELSHGSNDDIEEKKLHPIEEGIPPLQHGNITDQLPNDLPMLPLDLKTYTKKNDSVTLKGWYRLQHPITSLYAGKFPYVSRGLLQFPFATGGDNKIDLALHLRTTRLNLIKGFLDAETGQLVYHPSMAYIKVDAFRVTPILAETKKEQKRKDRVITIDGERAPYEPIQVESHPKLLTVLSLHGKFITEFLAKA